MKKISLIITLLLSCLFTQSYAQTQPLPPGNYQQTCSYCRIGVDNVLRCLCLDKNNVVRRTVLLVPSQCRYIENINGSLRCTRYGYQNGSNYPVIREYEAGPIWNQSDAEVKCPAICTSHSGSWTGQWRTTETGRMSICECTIKGNRLGITIRPGY